MKQFNSVQKINKSVLGWIFFFWGGGGSKLKSDLRVVDDFVDESSRGTSRELSDLEE